MGGSVSRPDRLSVCAADTTGARDHLELVSWLSWFGDYLRLGLADGCAGRKWGAVLRLMDGSWWPTS